MKTVIALIVGVALGAGCMHLLKGETDNQQVVRPKLISNTAIKGEESVDSLSLNYINNLPELIDESTLTVPISAQIGDSNNYLSVDADRHRLANQETDEESLNKLIVDSPENIKLSRLWELNKDTIGWDDIERAAPNLTYEQKLNLESLLLESPEDGLDMLMFAVRFPNSGSNDRDLWYLALNAVNDISADNMFLLDSLIEDACGQQASPRKIMMFFNAHKINIERAYQKRNLSELRRLIYENPVCSDI